jgi:hypothetical protein
MTPQLLGWLCWGVLCVVAAGWTFGFYYRQLTGGKGVPSGINTIIVLWWILIGWTFYHWEFNKLHLFWLALLACSSGLLFWLALLACSSGLLLLLGFWAFSEQLIFFS